MSLWHFIRRLFSNNSQRRTQAKEQRYDNVQITNAADGTTIQGHNAVKSYFENEQKLHEVDGSSIMFQIYRINMQAKALDELHSKILTEIKVTGDFVSGDDTVLVVKEKVRSLLKKETELQDKKPSQFDATINASDQITFYFNDHPMQDESLFYADNFIMLPAWVQVLLHPGGFKGVVQLMLKLRDKNKAQ